MFTWTCVEGPCRIQHMLKDFLGRKASSLQRIAKSSWDLQGGQHQKFVVGTFLWEAQLFLELVGPEHVNLLADTLLRSSTEGVSARYKYKVLESRRSAAKTLSSHLFLRSF